MKRREFIATTSVSIAAVAAGCGDDDGAGPGGDGGAGADAGPGDVLAWATVPPQVFRVGVPMEIDLRDYLNDPSSAAAITLDMPLPAGLTFDDGVIRGTPTAEAAPVDYVATADDGV